MYFSPWIEDSARYSSTICSSNRLGPIVAALDIPCVASRLLTITTVVPSSLSVYNLSSTLFLCAATCGPWIIDGDFYEGAVSEMSCCRRLSLVLFLPLWVCTCCYSTLRKVNNRISFRSPSFSMNTLCVMRTITPSIIPTCVSVSACIANFGNRSKQSSNSPINTYSMRRWREGSVCSKKMNTL